MHYIVKVLRLSEPEVQETLHDTKKSAQRQYNHIRKNRPFKEIQLWRANTKGTELISEESVNESEAMSKEKQFQDLIQLSDKYSSHFKSVLVKGPYY
jgi:hypothetical protein